MDIIQKGMNKMKSVNPNYTAKHQQNTQPVYCNEIEVNGRYEHYCSEPYTTVTRPGKTYNIC